MAKQNLHQKIDSVFLTKKQIKTRVKELGKQITKDYAGKSLVIVGVLKGSTIFLADLIRCIDLPCVIDFVTVKSYEGTESKGKIQTFIDLREDIKGKDVLIVEDIADTGLTLNFLTEVLKSRSPKSLQICTLLDKPSRRKVKVRPRYVGFKIPNLFVVGYGLDYNELYRNLCYIGIFKQSELNVTSI